MSMFEHEEVIKNAIVSKLKAGNLTPFWVDKSSQFLDVGSNVFVELVLNDGNKLQEFEEVVNATRREFQELEIDSIVRALWVVKTVRHGEPVYSGGTLRAADMCEATLVSGTRTTVVHVEVTWAAFERLKKEVQEDRHEVADQELVEVAARIVKDFLVIQLSSGGTSYWDPLRYPHVAINEAAMAYIARRSRTYRQLEAAVNYTFDQPEDNPLLSDLLQNLTKAAITIHNAEEALKLLPAEAFGGAYVSGEDFETNAAGAYEKLSSKEQILIETHFRTRVDELEKSVPDLVSTFPRPSRK